MDLLFGLSFLVISPILLWFFRAKYRFILNMISVVLGRKSFVGYIQTEKHKMQQLPKIKPGILPPYNIQKNTSEDTIDRLNLMYAKNFNVLFDIQVIISNWKKLDLTH
jgi:lipopolysaccharide/colanic/teichoic acid biosynthesis glycosyltransferase